MRFETEIAQRNFDIESLGLNPGFSFTITDADYSLLSVSGNVLVDIDLVGELGLYAGGGLGVARAEVDGTGDDNIFITYQVMAGLSYSLTPNLTATAGYRFFSSSSANDVSDDFELEPDFEGPEFDSIEIGLR